MPFNIDLNFVFFGIQLLIQVLSLLFMMFIALASRRPSWTQRVQAKKGKEYKERQWQKQLKSWGIQLPAQNAMTLLQEMDRSWEIVQPTLAQVALFMCIDIQWMINTSMLELGLRGMSEALNEFLTFMLLSIVFVCMLLVRSGSYIVGLRRLRRQKTRDVFFGDARPRQLSSYRFSLFRVLLFILVLSGVALTGIALSHTSLTLTLQLPGGTRLSLPGGKLLYGLPALAMVIIFIVAEMLSGQVATFSRQFVVSDVAMARQVEDLFRARVISYILGDECFALGFLFIALWFLLYSPVQSSLSSSLAVLFQAGMWLTFVTCCIGIAAYACNGRIGGSFTGWFWQRSIA
jgi:hypothetical protein